MSRILFEEKQSSSKSIYIWVLMMVSSLPILIIFSMGAYHQLLKGESWGNHPLSDRGLIILIVLTLTVLFTAAFLALGSSLYTKVTSEAIAYKYPPLLRKWKRIDPTEVAGVSRQQRNIINQGSYRKTIFSSTIEISVLGWEQVCIVLTTGDKVILGTQHPDILEHEIKKLISREET